MTFNNNTVPLFTLFLLQKSRGKCTYKKFSEAKLYYVMERERETERHREREREVV